MATFRDYTQNLESQYWQLDPASAAAVSRYFKTHGIKQNEGTLRERRFELWEQVLTGRPIYESCSREELEKFITAVVPLEKAVKDGFEEIVNNKASHNKILVEVAGEN